MPNSLKSLLPCPWCGSALENPKVIEGSTFRWRLVDGCCAPGPEVRHNTMADDQAAAEIESTQDAITAWNTRAPIAEGGDFTREVFRIAGGDVECCPNPTQEQALACLKDLRQCYDESLSRQGGEYDREMIAEMLDELEPVVGLQHIRESVANQARLLRAAANRDAAGVHTGRASEAGDWVLVPREPTDPMIDAGVDARINALRVGGSGNPSADTYRAMIAAAPAPGGDA